MIDEVKAVSDLINGELIVSRLLSNPELYLKIEKPGKMNKYHSFDQYLKRTHNTMQKALNRFLHLTFPAI